VIKCPFCGTDDVVHGRWVAFHSPPVTNSAPALTRRSGGFNTHPRGICRRSKESSFTKLLVEGDPL
jgi:hypothetical protein